MNPWGVIVTASEGALDLIPGGTVQDVTPVPIFVKGEPRRPDKSTQKQVLDGPGLKQSSITDP